MSYTGYEKDQRKYHGDIPKGTMTAVYDDETGECLKCYITNCNGEKEEIILPKNHDNNKIDVYQ